MSAKSISGPSNPVLEENKILSLYLNTDNIFGNSLLKIII